MCQPRNGRASSVRQPIHSPLKPVAAGAIAVRGCGPRYYRVKGRPMRIYSLMLIATVAVARVFGRPTKRTTILEFLVMVVALIEWVASHRTLGAFTTCMATYGSGAGTGPQPTAAQTWLTTRPDLRQAKNVCCVAGRSPARPANVRAAYRLSFSQPGYRVLTFGFRLARTYDLSP